MCVRTKVSYGCGHVFKITTDCHSSTCPGVDKTYHEKVGECRDCRSESAMVVRGRENKGRDVQRTKRSKTRVRTNSSSEETLPAEYDVSGGTGPWAPQVKQEKTWESPHRKRADEAWLSEHEDRMSDLQDRLEKVKVSDKDSQSQCTNDLLSASESHDYEEYDTDDYEFMSETPTKGQLQLKLQRNIVDRVERSHASRHQDRQHSHDSLPDSMPSYRSSPKLRQASTFNAVNVYPEATHEYDYYNTIQAHVPIKHNHRRHYQGLGRLRTDPYLYHRSYGYDSDHERVAAPPPMQIPPPAPGVYDTYEYYSPNASPSGRPYGPYDPSRIPPPQPHHFVEYRRF